MKLRVQRLFTDLDPPGFRAPIASVRPPIGAGFQQILHVEGTVFGKDSDPRALAGRIELGECSAKPDVLLRQNLDQGKAVVDGTMTIVKVTRLADQIAELGPLEIPCRPVDFRIRACPGLARKDW